MIRSKGIILRKIHKYMGLVIGIQFLFWTLGGIFFSWSNLDQIHSDPYKSSPERLNNEVHLASPQKLIEHVSLTLKEFEIGGIELLKINGSPVYRMGISDPGNNRTKYFLADAVSGEVRAKLSKEESIDLAVNAFKPDTPVSNVELLTDENVGRHHEYRGGILPAYAVSFDHPSGVTIYVSPEMGKVVTWRNSNWRIFDFLWMMHTMDYSGRDNFGNYLLRFMALLGLLTIISGLILFFISRKSRNL